METQASKSKPQTREIKINIRAKLSQRDLIDRAAEIQGKSRSDFMLETACREAQDVLLDRRLFAVDDQVFEQFQALLDAPPVDNENLRLLLTTKAPWE